MRLKMSLKPHRSCLPANAQLIKLFLGLEMQVDFGAAAEPTEPKRASVGILFLIDTSGSMSQLRLDQTQDEFGDGPPPAPGTSRLDAAITGLQQFANLGGLKPEDRVAVVHFDSKVETIIPFTSASETAKLTQAFEALRMCSGGTEMGQGLQHVLGLLGSSGTSAERIVLLSDGNTYDEDLVHDAMVRLHHMKVPIISIGFGTDWNTGLLSELSDSTYGRPYHVATDEQIADDAAASWPVSQFPRLLGEELRRAATEMLTDFRAFVSLAQGVRLMRATQITPQVREATIANGSFDLDNVGTWEPSICLLEFDIDARPPSKARLAQFGLTFRRVSNNTTGEVGPRDLSLEFSTDEARTATTDPQVGEWLAARNVYFLANEAAEVADADPAKAMAMLEQAERLCGRLNPVMTAAVRNATKQLSSGKTLTPASKKTLQVGAKTKTVQSGGIGGMTDEEIRKMSGT